MLDKQKIQLMSRLALYEQTDGKKDFKLNEYYRKDYASLHGVFSVLWVTLGYVCVVFLVGVVMLEKILANLTVKYLLTLGGIVMAGYLALCIIYAVISHILFGLRHKDARERVKNYNHDLVKLLRIYDSENKKPGTRTTKTSGGPGKRPERRK
jgi:hypothetical protein